MSGDVDRDDNLENHLDNDEYIQLEQESNPLNPRQQTIYTAQQDRFAEYLQEEGKNPKKSIGYAEDSISERLSRFNRAIEWIWSNIEVTTEFTTEHADRVIEALDTDEFRRQDGNRYAEGSKRKISNTLENWFDFQGIDWEPDVTFSDEEAKENADPFTKPELRKIWQASLTYKSIPSYNNLSPEERDQWKGYLAQELSKPKEEVRPADWDEVNKRWDIPSLIRTTREAGWRPDIISRMSVDWYVPEEQTIYIPAGEAPKNDAAWEQTFTDEAAFTLDQWLEQRENMEIYDGRDEIWLNREGNPYNSGSLNDLLDNLMEEAGIIPGDRNLVWYSFRHSIGTYVFEEYKSLKPVAEALRQKSRSSAARYVHSTKELKKEIAGVM